MMDLLEFGILGSALPLRQNYLRQQYYSTVEPSQVSFEPIRRMRSHFKKTSSLTQIRLRVFIAVALVFVLFQCSRAVITNTIKLVRLAAYHTQLEQLHHETVDTLVQTKDRIRFYASPQGVEELARNELEMVGKDEVLVNLIR